jgi:multiple antibiotic resistance protein
MNWLHIGVEALHIAGGVLLFIISLGMIFPNWMRGTLTDDGGFEGEPFIVPLATPLLAGPSTMATIMIFTSKQSELLGQWILALGIAWVISTLILLLSHRLSRILGQRGLVACERLMGMILTVIAVQMFLDGVRNFMETKPPIH